MNEISKRILGCIYTTVDLSDQFAHLVALCFLHHFLTAISRMSLTKFGDRHETDITAYDCIAQQKSILSFTQFVFAAEKVTHLNVTKTTIEDSTKSQVA